MWRGKQFPSRYKTLYTNPKVMQALF
ncbi:hypothetical protein ACQ27_gp446 [Klebsiella phage K64-1]|nr:hypothetical protein ACQ27_gp446 [Klebsiella phage K64-1]